MSNRRHAGRARDGKKAKSFRVAGVSPAQINCRGDAPAYAWEGLQPLEPRLLLSAISNENAYDRWICIDASADSNVQATAEALAVELEDMTGSDFDVIASKTAGNGIFLLNADEDLATYYPDLASQQSDLETLETMGNEGFFMYSGGSGSLYIIGNSDLALQEGAYCYLHELGWDVLLPGENWTVKPQLSSITITADSLIEPSYISRNFTPAEGVGSAGLEPLVDQIVADWDYWKETNFIGGAKLGGEGAWIAFNKANQAVLEANEDMRPYDVYNDPEDPLNPNHHVAYSDTMRPAYHSQAYRDLAAAYFVDLYESLYNEETNPNPIMSVSPEDGVTGWDQACVQYDPVSSQAYGMTKVIADALKAAYPDRNPMVSVLAYAAQAAIPLDPTVAAWLADPDSNVRVIVAPGGFQDYITGLNGDELLEAWADAKPKNLGVYEYWGIMTYGNLDWPAQSSYLSGQLEHWTELGYDSIQCESTYSAGALGIAYYTVSRLIWDSSLDPEAVKQEFYEKAFGPAAAPMGRMIERWSALGEWWAYTPQDIGLSFQDIAEARVLAADDPECLARVNDYAEYVQYLRLYGNWWEGTYLYASGSQERHDIDEALIRYVWQTHDSYMLQSYGISKYVLGHNTADAELQADWDIEDRFADGWDWVKANPFTGSDLTAAITSGLAGYAYGTAAPYHTVFDQPVYSTDVALQELALEGEGVSALDQARAISSQLVALDPDYTLDGVMIQTDSFVSTNTYFTFHVNPATVAEGHVDFQFHQTTTNPSGPNRVTVYDPNGEVVYEGEFTGTAWTPIAIDTETAGNYTMHIFRMYFEIQVEQNLPFVLTGNVHMYDSHPSCYFYVPSGMETVGLSLQGVGVSPTVKDSNGVEVTPSFGDGLMAEVDYDVAEGQDGKIWSIRDVFSSGSYPINLPRIWSFSNTGSQHGMMVPVNAAPTVDAGTDLTIVAPTDDVELSGKVLDDHMSASPYVSQLWTKISGPGTVTFDDNTDPEATATFSATGIYVLKLTATDSDNLSAYDEVTVEYLATAANTAPAVVAGNDFMPSYDVGDTGTFGLSEIFSSNTPAHTLNSLDDQYSARFTAMENVTVDRVYQRLIGVDANTYIEVGIMSDDGNGKPSGTFLASTGSIAAVNDYSWSVFTCSVNLVAGQVYHIVTRVTALDAGNAFSVYGSGSDTDIRPYDRATDTYFSVMTKTNGGAWTVKAQDTFFVLGNSSAIVQGPGYSYVGANTFTFNTMGGTATGTSTGQKFTISTREVAATDRVRMSDLTLLINKSGDPTDPLIVEVRNSYGEVLGRFSVDPSQADGTERTFSFDDGASFLLTPGEAYFITTHFGGSGGAYGQYYKLYDLIADSSQSAATWGGTTACVPIKSGVNNSWDNYDWSDPDTYNDYIDLWFRFNGEVTNGSTAVMLPDSLSLIGAVKDDGKPSSSLSYAWTEVRGPGTVYFANPAALNTTATFSEAGEYLLRLTASDGQLSAFDEVAVNVLAPTTYQAGDTDMFGLSETFSSSVPGHTLNSLDDQYSSRFTAMENITVDRVYQRLVGVGANTSVEIGIMADDGAGKPTGTYLASTGSITAVNDYSWAVFTSSVSLTAGQVYHVVTRVTALGTGESFSVYGSNSDTDIRPYDRATDTYFSVMTKTNGEAWTVKAQDSFFVLGNGSAIVQGPGYSYVGANTFTFNTMGGTATGTSAGQKFTISTAEVAATDRITVSGLTLLINKSGNPTDPLIVEVRKSDGEVLGWFSVDPSQADGTERTFYFDGGARFQLTPGQAYFITTRFGGSGGAYGQYYKLYDLIAASGQGAATWGGTTDCVPIQSGVYNSWDNYNWSDPTTYNDYLDLWFRFTGEVTAAPRYELGQTAVSGNYETFDYSGTGQTINSLDDKYDARFQTHETVTVDRVYQYLYGVDTATRIEVGIMADDGNGRPDGRYLVSTGSYDPANGNSLACSIFTQPVTLEAYKIYHIVTRPTARGSYDSFIVRRSSGNQDIRPYDRALDTYMSALTSTNGGAWTVNNYDPYFILANGANLVQGPGQPNQSTSTVTLDTQGGSTGKGAGQKFELSLGELPAYTAIETTALTVKLYKAGSPGNLVIKVRTSDGTVLGTITKAASSIATSMTQYSWTFDGGASVKLNVGQTYLITTEFSGGTTSAHYYFAATAASSSPDQGDAGWGGRTTCVPIQSAAGRSWTTWSTYTTRDYADLWFSFTGTVVVDPPQGGEGGMREIAPGDESLAAVIPSIRGSRLAAAVQHLADLPAPAAKAVAAMNEVSSADMVAVLDEIELPVLGGTGLQPVPRAPSAAMRHDYLSARRPVAGDNLSELDLTDSPLDGLLLGANMNARPVLASA